MTGAIKSWADAERDRVELIFTHKKGSCFSVVCDGGRFMFDACMNCSDLCVGGKLDERFMVTLYDA